MLAPIALAAIVFGPCVHFVPENLFGAGVAPIAERAFGVLHDVPLVNKGHTATFVPDRIIDGSLHEANRSQIGYGLYSDADDGFERQTRCGFFVPCLFQEIVHRFLCAEADFGEVFWKNFLQEFQNLLGLGRAAGVFDASIDVFAVFAKDHHVHLFGMLHGRRHTVEVLNRAEADVQIQKLAQGHIERPNTAADRSRKRPFDADQELLEAFDRVVRQPIIEALLGGFAGINFEPGDFALATIGLLDGGFEDSMAGGPDVGSRAVAADEWDYGIIWNDELAVADRDLPACWW